MSIVVKDDSPENKLSPLTVVKSDVIGISTGKDIFSLHPESTGYARLKLNEKADARATYVSESVLVIAG